MLTYISGEVLQKLRILKGIKQSFIAKKLGISQPRYCKIEKKETIQGDLFRDLKKVLSFTDEEVENIKQMLSLP